MTHKGTWKGAESKVASWFGSTRTPLSGGNSKHTRSDTLHPKLFIAVKYRANHTLVALYLKTKQLAAKENKIPVVVPINKGSHCHLVLVDVRHLKQLAECLRLPSEEKPTNVLKSRPPRMGI